jgi:hypothetical protein
MTALAQDRNTPRAEGDVRSFGVAASQLIYAGAIAAMNASGYAVEGSTAVGLVGIGRAEERVDNSGGSAGDLSIKVRRGIFRYGNSASSDEITIAHRGRLCYIVDDQTVALTDNSGARSVAGIIDDVDALGVWVEFDLTKTVAALQALKGGLGRPTFTIGAEGGDAIAVAIQLKDIFGNDLARRASVLAYFSDDANGDSIAATAFDTVAAGTDGVVIEPISNNLLMLTSEADGDIDIAIGENAAVTKYLVIVMPDGSLVPSGAITFA